MFQDDQAPPLTPEQEMLTKIMQELDEIKRYVAGTYASVDTEIGEIREAVKQINAKVHETDRQVDRIEQYDRQLSEIRAAVQRMERKIK